jgi:hypothetical protein
VVIRVVDYCADVKFEKTVILWGFWQKNVPVTEQNLKKP